MDHNEQFNQPFAEIWQTQQSLYPFPPETFFKKKKEFWMLILNQACSQDRIRQCSTKSASCENSVYSVSKNRRYWNSARLPCMAITFATNNLTIEVKSVEMYHESFLVFQQCGVRTCSGTCQCSLLEEQGPFSVYPAWPSPSPLTTWPLKCGGNWRPNIPYVIFSQGQKEPFNKSPHPM